MSRPYFSVKHVESMALLPEKLTPGRIYFVDDEQVIIIDHGNGFPPVTYGGRPGGQGGTTAGSSDNLTSQLNTLAQTSLAVESFLWNEGIYLRDEISRLDENVGKKYEMLFDLVNTNAQNIINLVWTVKETFESYDSAIATLAKTVSNLYPEEEHSGDGD